MLRTLEQVPVLSARAQFNVFDDLNRHVAEISPREGVTSFTYDAAGNMTSLRDAVQNTTEWTFDRRNRLTADTITLTETDATNNPTGAIIQRQRLLEETATLFVDGRRVKDEGPSEAELYAEIGRLKVELEWLKKKHDTHS